MLQPLSQFCPRRVPDNSGRGNVASVSIPVYDPFLAGSQDGQILFLEESVMELFWHSCQICGSEASRELRGGGLGSESKMTKPVTNRKDKFSNMIILSGQLTKNKCSLAPCGNDNFKKRTQGASDNYLVLLNIYEFQCATYILKDS